MSIRRDDLRDWLSAYAQRLDEQRQYLTKLDSAIGDADHGTNMHRGFKAAMEKLADDADGSLDALLKTVGMTLVSKTGGASGPLYGTLFMKAAAEVQGKDALELDDWAGMLQAALDGVKQRGKAEPGDKTMIDALQPAVDALREAAAQGASFADALTASARAAHQGMEDTIPLVARKGRASYLGERSKGHQDPGATSTCYLIETAAQVLKDRA